MRGTWILINDIIGKKTESVDAVIKKNFKTENIKNIAKNFALKFKENVTNLIHSCNIQTIQIKDTSIRNSMYMDPTYKEEIINILKSLNHNKGAGIDGIRPKDLKMHANILAQPIMEFINDSIKEGIVPTILKTSVVRPIFKSGKGNDYNNYRPISILPVIEKVLEEIVVRRLSNFLNKYNIIDSQQFGFQKGKNINQLLGKFSNYINNCLDNKMHCLALFIDFSKAFDTLSHKKLIEMLERHGIRGQCISWFENYLICRSYIVNIDGHKSQKEYVSHGVPQGSKLGPILYLIYSNDLLKQLNNSKTFAYADDTAIIVANHKYNTAAQILQKELDVVTRWSHDNGLIINATKTKFMHIRLPHIARSNTAFKFHNTECLHKNWQQLNANDHCEIIIEQVDSYKYLGVILDKNFNWKEQIMSVNKKLRKTSYVLYHLNNCAPLEVTKQAYFSLAESYIRHGITAYGSSNHCSIIQKTQTRLIKTLMKNKISLRLSSQVDDIQNFCKIHNILNFKNIYKSAIINELLDHTTLREISHSHFTRRRKEGRYIVPKFKSKYGKRTIDFQLPTILNSMPPHFIDTSHKLKRKAIIKNYYINSQ